jgi:phosphopantothenoylcysteine decarboxylase / phosphopantothenate---cysteine ligase
MVHAGRKVALAVSGSIAAYKAVEVARLLLAQGVRVVPVMTRSAAHFIGPMTLSGICGAKVVTDMFDPEYAGEAHVEIGREADVVALVPATADLIARLAEGRADDLVTAVAMCATGPVLVAPAMHTRMWNHPATRRNVATLLSDGRVKLVGPVDGPLASGESGMGRLAAPEDIAAAILRELSPPDLRGLRVVVTAGPTVEDLDPVRFISNRSTGRMGFAVAERAARRGAEVILIAGPVEIATPPGVRRVDVRGVRSLRDALGQALREDLGGAHALVMAAAVADYAPAEVHDTKMKKGDERLTLELVKTPDLLREIGHRRTGPSPVLVGFALETSDDAGLVVYARKKLADKKVDMVVANHASDGFGGTDNRATVVWPEREETLGAMSKLALADEILNRVRMLCTDRGLSWS